MNDGEPDTLIDSRSAFQDCLRAGFEEAARVGCRDIFVADADFANWPLGERAVIGHLTHWAHSHRRLTLLAASFDSIVRLHPRWVDWRRQWAHVVECRANTELEAGEMPTLCIAPGLFSLRLVDAVHFRGRASRTPAGAVRDRQCFDALLQHSMPAFPATVTGL